MLTAEQKRARARGYYAKNKEKYKARALAYYAKNKEKCAANQKAWQAKNPEKMYQSRLKWIKKNKDKVAAADKRTRARHPERVRKNSRDYYLANRAAEIKRAAVREGRMKTYQTPRWLSPVQLLEIKEFYLLAKELNWLSEEPLQVDHIVPLNGKNVSGLHVPWNLQILPRSLNNAKSNKHV